VIKDVNETLERILSYVTSVVNLQPESPKANSAKSAVVNVSYLDSRTEIQILSSSVENVKIGFKAQVSYCRIDLSGELCTVENRAVVSCD